MKLTTAIFKTTAACLILAGCEATVSGDGGYAAADYGYYGPGWIGPGFYSGVWYGPHDNFVQPHVWDHGQSNDHGRPGGGGGRPMPSIPSASRPASHGGGGSAPHAAGGGGGGGHAGGGGGGGHHP